MDKTFSPVTPAQIASFRTQLAANGMPAPEGDSGTINDTKHGVTMTFAYDGTSSLALTITNKPWWMPTSMIWSALEGYLA